MFEIEDCTCEGLWRMNKPSGGYHHHGFLSGELIGKFQKKYKSRNTVPWHQDEQAY